MELVMDERNQLLEGGFVALAPREEEFGDLGGVLGNAAILNAIFRRFNF
jgi:hypothetical protein